MNKAMTMKENEEEDYLVKNTLSCADFMLSCSLMRSFQTVVDKEFRKECPAVEKWFKRMFEMDCMVKVHGYVIMAVEALDAHCIEEVK